ncbi:MAG: hypothetical protein ACYC5G_04005 [Candidatus Doudnabacteria bacterium]
MTLYENDGAYQTEEGMFQMALQQASKKLDGVASSYNMDIFQQFAWNEYKAIKDLFTKVCEETTVLSYPNNPDTWGSVFGQTVFIENKSGTIMLTTSDLKKLESAMGARFLGK